MASVPSNPDGLLDLPSPIIPPMKKNPDLVKFGANVRRLRLKRGLSQKALAERSGLSANFIGTLERGCQNPSLTTLEKVAKGLGCSMAKTCQGLE